MSVDSNSVSLPLALEAVRLIFNNISQAYKEGDDISTRRGMYLASMNVGIAIEISGVCGSHAAAYAFAVKNKPPHGVSCAIALPYVMEYNAPACLSKLADIAGAVGVRKSSQSLEEAAFKAVKAVRDLTERVAGK